MERQRRPSMGAWLEETAAELQDIIRVLENLGFHHAEEGTAERDHYDRVVLMEGRVSAQAKRIPKRAYSVQEESRSATQDPMDFV